MSADEEYFNGEEFQELLRDYESAVSAGDGIFMDADDLTDIAEYYQMNDRSEDADVAIEHAIAIDPTALSVLNYQIHEALQEGDVEKAQDFLERIMERESPEYVFGKAEILVAQDRIEEADEFLRSVYQDVVEPDEMQDFVLDVVNIYTDYGQGEKAMEWMMRAKQDNTDDFKEMMARTLFGLGKYEDSERIFNELIDRDPFQKRYWHALASAQYMKEDYGASVTSSEYAIAIDPDDPEGVLAKANALFRLENNEEALKYFERYSQLVPDDECAMMHQGVCLINMSRYQEAIERLKKTLEMCPDDSELLVDIYQEMAFAYGELHDLDNALLYIDKTDALDCDHEDMMVIRGHILLNNNRPEEAERMYSQALKRSGNDPHVMMRIIVSLYDNKFLEAAYTMFKMLFSCVDDSWKEGYAYMALCCWDSGKYEEFMEFLQLACQKNPQESKMVLAQLFPVGIDPKDYYEYMKERINK